MNASAAHDSSAEARAALWAARLDGSTLGADDRNELDAWLAENPAHRTLLSQYCQFSADLEQELPVLVATGAVAMPAVKSAARRRFPGFGWIGGGALVAAAVVAAVVWFAPPRVPRFENIVTAVAQRQTITLRDGTRVDLNAHTSLVVENGGAARRVRLTDGEAFFAVAKDKAHPFIVETPGGSVRVTGTQFDVRSGTAAELEVTVAQGSVQVRPSDLGGTRPVAPVALKPGERLSVTATSVQRRELSVSALQDALAWREGRVVFDRTPLADAVAVFARYHGRSIQLSPAALAADKKMSGNPSLDDLDGFLTGLEKSNLGVRVERDASGNYLVRLASEPAARAPAR